MQDVSERASPLPRHGPDSYPGVALFLALIAGLLASRFISYLVFHSVVEIFTIAVACSVFFLAWNARHYFDNDYLLFIAIASLFIAGIDTIHTLAYKGMGILGRGADLPTQLWIAGRYLQSLSFLIAPIFIGRKLNPRLAFGIYAGVTLLLLGIVLGTGLFPHCFIDGAGLTPFKIYSEFAISAIFLASCVALLRQRDKFEPAIVRKIAASIFALILGELAFTLYNDVYDIANATGHLLRFLASYLIYRAIIVTGLVRPYGLLFRNLVRSEEALKKANERLELSITALRRSDERYRAFVSNSSEGILRMELDEPVPTSLPESDQARRFIESGFVAECNDTYARMYDRNAADQMIGTRLPELLAGSTDSGAGLLGTFIRSGYRLFDTEFCRTDAAGALRCFSLSFNGVIENGCIVRAWGVMRDITERKRATAERERLITELQQALAEVKTLSGLLPICANCKKIRDDRGYWTQVESYISQRTEVSFSHGFCPDCIEALYPEYARE